MRKIFDKPLRQQNTKVGTSELVNDSISESEHRNVKGSKSSKTPLWDPLTSGSTTKAAAATASSTRPSRSTRSAPTYDIDDPPNVPEVFKYSEVVGLGNSWDK
jgi:hypothetical protein